MSKRDNPIVLERLRLRLQRDLAAAHAAATRLQDTIKAVHLKTCQVSCPRPKVLAIQQAVASHYGMDLSVMSSPRRHAIMIAPRHLAMWLCRELTPYSLQDIADCFGGRDHGTVCGACVNIEHRLKQPREAEFAAAVAALKATLAEQLKQVDLPLFNRPVQA